MFNKIISLLLTTFQGNNPNSLSSRRMTAFWFVVISTLNAVSIHTLIYLITLKTIIVENEKLIIYLDRMIDLQYILCAMILILFGIVTTQAIFEIIQSVRGGFTKTTETTTSTETNKKEIITPNEEIN